MGFPIRKSSDQSSFAAPQGLSQRTTSFIASQRQGIHRMLLRHLITLMIDVRRPFWGNSHNQKDHVFGSLRRRLLAEHIRSNGAVTPSLVAETRKLGCRICSLFTISNITSSLFKGAREALRLRTLSPGGARRDRTDDLLLAKQALSQLSYGPKEKSRRNDHGGPGTTRTSDLTLIRGAL